MTDSILWPYFSYSLKLTGKPRRGGSNMFRHQMDTFAILMEYGHVHSVLLKASLIHDIIEDCKQIDKDGFREILSIDNDAPLVLELVIEVSQRVIEGIKEPKKEFLLRIMHQGSAFAKILKLADRLSNLSALPMAGENDFKKKYVAETKECIVPFADKIDPNMAIELNKWIEITLKTIQK